VQRLISNSETSDGVPSLEQLLTRYWASLVAYATRLLGDNQAAEDVVQRAFVRLWENRYPIESEDAARALLYRVVRNLASNEWRHERVRDRWVSDQWVDEPESVNPQHLLEYDEMRTAIERAVEQLPPRRREVFVLSRYHGLSNDEIASVLAISPQTVANQLVSSLRTLRDLLTGNPGPEVYPPLKVVRQRKSQAG
jgi:RNA polymerase sigma-70 factor (ECF subfamily)